MLVSKRSSQAAEADQGLAALLERTPEDEERSSSGKGFRWQVV
jgi:hypothetical protein